MLSLTHGTQLANEFVFGPLFAFGPQRDAGDDEQFGVVRVRHVQVVHQHNVRILQEPVAAPVECGQNGRVHVAAVDALPKHRSVAVQFNYTVTFTMDKCSAILVYLSALHFEFHVVLARRFAVLALLPAVAVAPVAHFLARVEQHGATFGPSFCVGYFPTIQN